MKSKIKFILLTLTILAIPAIHAQKRIFEPEVYLGLNGGMTASMLYFNPQVKQSYLTGYNGGLTFRYIGKKSLGVQAELNYSQRGWKESDGLYARQLNYIELPFMTHFNFGDKFRYFFNIGPKISYLLSENILIDNTQNSTAEQHIKAVENPLDYGFSLGTGALIKIKKQVLQIEARGNYSVSNVFSDVKKDYFNYSNNLNASVNFTWLFQIK